MSLPLRLRACMPLGRTSGPELRLQLLQLRLGAGVGAKGVQTCGGEGKGGAEGGGGSGGGTGASICGNVSNSSRGGADSSVDSSSGNDSVKERRRWWRRLGRGMRQLLGSCQAAAWWWPYGGWDVAHAAGVLLLLRVMLPDQVRVGRGVGRGVEGSVDRVEVEAVLLLLRYMLQVQVHIGLWEQAWGEGVGCVMCLSSRRVAILEQSTLPEKSVAPSNEEEDCQQQFCVPSLPHGYAAPVQHFDCAECVFLCL